jgi:hypothetical protein
MSRKETCVAGLRVKSNSSNVSRILIDSLSVSELLSLCDIAH